MLVVVELAATLGDRQHQEERKDRLSDLSKEDSQQSTYLVLFCCTDFGDNHAIG